jgi:hypothetical protein
VSELDCIGCELYNLGLYWIFLLWIMDVDPFPHILGSMETTSSSWNQPVM